MLPLILSLTALAADCPKRTSPQDIVSEAEEASLAWASLDEEGFSESVAKIDAAIRCVGTPLDGRQAALVHRLHGLQAFVSGDQDDARLHLAAASTADPGYRVSDRVAPKGGALRRLIDEVSSEEHDAGAPLELMDGGTVWVDGRASGGRDEGRYAVVQIGERGRTVWSTVLKPGESFSPPTSAIAQLSAEEGRAKPIAVPSAPVTDRERRGIGPLWVAASGTGVAAAGLFGASAALRSRYDESPSKSLHSATNGTFLASTGLAALTGGLFTAAVTRKRKNR
ncbi:MAG: hypothetical protein AB8H79_21320 [Myxococcota bacterium]